MKKNHRINAAIYRLIDTLGDFAPAWMTDMLDNTAWRATNWVDAKLPTYSYDEMVDAYWEAKRTQGEASTDDMANAYAHGYEEGMGAGFDLASRWVYTEIAQDIDFEVEERIHEAETEQYELDQMALEMQEQFAEFDVYVSYDPNEEQHYASALPYGFHLDDVTSI